MKHVVHHVAASMTEHVKGISFALQAQMKTRLQKLLRKMLQPLKRLLIFSLLPQVGFQALVCCVQMQQAW